MHCIGPDDTTCLFTSRGSLVELHEQASLHSRRLGAMPVQTSRFSGSGYVILGVDAVTSTKGAKLVDWSNFGVADPAATGTDDQAEDDDSTDPDEESTPLTDLGCIGSSGSVSEYALARGDAALWCAGKGLRHIARPRERRWCVRRCRRRLPKPRAPARPARPPWAELLSRRPTRVAR